MATFNLAHRIDVKDKSANIDSLYGPYNSIKEALAAIPINRRVVGRTAGIVTGGIVKEYWWKNGVEDSDFTVKGDSVTFSLLASGNTYTHNLGKYPSVTVMVQVVTEDETTKKTEYKEIETAISYPDENTIKIEYSPSPLNGIVYVV